MVDELSDGFVQFITDELTRTLRWEKGYSKRSFYMCLCILLALFVHQSSCLIGQSFVPFFASHETIIMSFPHAQLFFFFAAILRQVSVQKFYNPFARFDFVKECKSHHFVECFFYFFNFFC